MLSGPLGWEPTPSRVPHGERAHWRVKRERQRKKAREVVRVAKLFWLTTPPPSPQEVPDGDR